MSLDKITVLGTKQLGKSTYHIGVETNSLKKESYWYIYKEKSKKDKDIIYYNSLNLSAPDPQLSYLKKLLLEDISEIWDKGMFLK